LRLIKKIGSKFQALYFIIRLRINGMWGLPAQTKKEIRILKTVFDHFAGKKKIKIFEWGSGFSSIYYAQYLKKKNAEFEWHSIDNNKVWHEKIVFQVKKKQLMQHVRLYCKEFIPFWEKPDWGLVPPKCGFFGPKSENEKNYIMFPKLLNEKFDILIIDARFRRLCLQAAKEVLLPEGVVILHDAQKSHYHPGLEDFRYSKFFITGAWYPFQNVLNKLWIGSMGNSRIFDVLNRL